MPPPPAYHAAGQWSEVLVVSLRLQTYVYWVSLWMSQGKECSRDGKGNRKVETVASTTRELSTILSNSPVTVYQLFNFSYKVVHL